ncbi:cytochrome o ubiquinol oxidase subunit III [Mesobaculum littorinae]|uniref:Cytochrome bo(3) ubiquinol oxidase subunit 3 n=1 Tax=Mesobaculum littorinae TaxID=2486419 RepID=A0A438ADM3_9RHOB|nr:cytochrome c oxidase subunit 3 [Mesobaculum littorinae]RVV96791.1 cytochrome o ubiquinol oxidase subunit III [Mesobaculum littorinae]
MSGADTRHPGLNLGQTDAGGHDAAEEVVFGFWVFLMSDMVLFAILFATYATMSTHGQAGGPAPLDLVDLGSALAETLLLLGSSFTFGMASLALKYREGRTRLVAWLALTFVLGAVFVGWEVHDVHVWITQDDAPPQRSGFLSAHYLLTATHGLHVAAGLLWMAVIAVQIGWFGLIREVKLRLMRLALFWHMLDIVWIGIFTFVFLYGAVR